MSKPDRPYRKKTIGNHHLKPESLVMGYGYDPMLSEGSVKPPIFQTSTFAFRNAAEGAAYFRKAAGKPLEGDAEDPGLAYSRINNPNLEVLEDRLTLFDGAAEALAFSSGMGAITTALLTFLDAGSVVLHASPVYGATETFIRNTLPRFGVTTEEFFASADEEEIWAAAERAMAHGPVNVIYTETPTNPTNEMVDLKLAAAIANRCAEAQNGHRPVVMTDNTMMGPIGPVSYTHLRAQENKANLG